MLVELPLRGRVPPAPEACPLIEMIVGVRSPQPATKPVTDPRRNWVAGIDAMRAGRALLVELMITLSHIGLNACASKTR